VAENHHRWLRSANLVEFCRLARYIRLIPH